MVYLPGFGGGDVGDKGADDTNDPDQDEDGKEEKEAKCEQEKNKAMNLTPQQSIETNWLMENYNLEVHRRIVAGAAKALDGKTKAKDKKQEGESCKGYYSRGDLCRLAAASRQHSTLVSQMIPEARTTPMTKKLVVAERLCPDDDLEEQPTDKWLKTPAQEHEAHLEDFLRGYDYDEEHFVDSDNGGESGIFGIFGGGVAPRCYEDGLFEGGPAFSPPVDLRGRVRHRVRRTAGPGDDGRGGATGSGGSGGGDVGGRAAT